ncbi:hypothetical protein [Brevundimonas faecalis]|uniref:Spore coat protein U domain-containing protein n=1 Tax=Brevundimonas faecalis TaxID=947378 RepID=A0ABV2REA5_9CAUL
MISAALRNAALASLFFFGVLGAGGQAAAQAKCALTIDSTSDQWVIRYNPLEDDVAVREFDLTLRNSGGTPCNGRINTSLRGEAYGLTSPGSSVRVPYGMRDQQSGANITPTSGQSNINSGPQLQVPREGQVVAKIQVAVNPPANLGYGRYTQTVYISLRAANGEVHAEEPIVLVLEAAPAAIIGLKGEFTRQGGTPTIDLGQLTQGVRTLNTSVYVHSTGGYRMSVTSQNQGRLRQTGTAWYIDYGLKLGTRPVNMTAPYSFDVVSSQARNDDYPLTISVGDTAGKRAGDYSDILTFTIAAI